MEPLAGDDRAVLHRVLVMLEDERGQGLISPAVRDAIGEGTQLQQRDLTDDEGIWLAGTLHRLTEEWASPRLFREPTQSRFRDVPIMYIMSS